MSESKDTNPKDAVGIKKVPFSVVPWRVVARIALGLLEGARKYGRHNYRVVGVRTSVYVDATIRHIVDYWEGTDIDPDSGLHHLDKALSSLTVLRDAQLQNMATDDRPPKVESGWIQEYNKEAESIIEKYPNAIEPYTELNKNSSGENSV